MMDFTLRNRINEAKAEYLKYGEESGWMWTDEGLPWAIQDYHSSVGSVMNFTEDDWRVCKENGWTLDEVCVLCNECEFQSCVNSLADFFSYFSGDRSEEDVVCDVKDFYKWRAELLPIVEKIYADSWQKSTPDCNDRQRNTFKESTNQQTNLRRNEKCLQMLKP